MPVLISSLPKKGKRYLYKGRYWTLDKPVPYSTRANKKRMVLAKKGPYAKIVHYGQVGCLDYTIHRSKSEREKYRKRHSKIKLGSGRPAYKDKWSPAYWSWKDLWKLPVS